MNRIAVTILLWLFESVSSLAYTKLGNNLYESNGTQADTQAAINVSKAWSTIIIPNGSYTWSSSLILEKPVRLCGQSKDGVTIINNVNENDLVTVAVSAAIGGEIWNLNLMQGNGNGSGRHLVIRTPILLHDCYFETNGRIRRSVEWATNGGVIWNCRFYSNRQDNNGIAFKSVGLNRSWTTNSTMGDADTQGTANTYVEDCTFKDLFLQALDFDDNSRTVVRHCTFDNSAISSHGQDTSPAGTRHWEVYDNRFIFTASGENYPLNVNFFFFVRGGTGIIADNVIPRIASQEWGQKSEILLTVFNIRRSSQFIACQTRYPAARQIGQSWRNGSLVTDPVCIWGNTGGGNYDRPGITDSQPDQCGQGQLSANYIKAGRDYIIGSPKPGYTEYPYPHPLRRSASTAPEYRPPSAVERGSHG